MGNFKMPTVEEFLMKKTIYGKKTDPVWVYLEREMIQNIEKKPYNQVVGDWLRFLKDLRYHYYREALRKKQRLVKEIGPSWYCELSSAQRQVLTCLRANIHQDLLSGLPATMRQSLSDLGVTLKIPTPVLMQAMTDSVNDPGVFIWNLYFAIYKASPSHLRARYDTNAMILMSSLVFIDLDECIEQMEKLTASKKEPQPVIKKKLKKNSQPNVRYGEYLQRCYVPFYSSRPVANKPTKPLPLGYRLRLRSEESYTRLRNDTKFLTKRKERNMKEREAERICTYEFWEPPTSLRSGDDPAMASLGDKLKMISLKAKPQYKSPYANIQFQVAGVSFSGGTPVYMLQNVAIMPTGYIPIHGGIVEVCGAYVPTLLGHWRFPVDISEKCDKSCDCIEKWEKKVMDYLKESKCYCGHLYDFFNEGKFRKNRFFLPPSRHMPHRFDQAKIYQMDSMEDFIKDTVRDALLSKDPTPEASLPDISATGSKLKDLVAAFLSELSDTPLLIPHLPQACLLNNLQEWVRQRVYGKITPKETKRYKLVSQRRWLDLKHMDFKARAYMIPFKLKELENMNWSHRHQVQKLFEILLENFVTRNRSKQLEQTRLWWATTKYDAYPSKAFLDIFFTYMPSRMKDTFLINPYSSQLTPKYGAKTCPL